MKNYDYPIVIIGSGISGLYSALKISQKINKEHSVLVVTKSTLGESNSFYAQGGMVAVLKSNSNDSVSSHVSDTLIAGAGLSETETVEFISEYSDDVVKDLLNFGVKFDCDDNGDYKLTKEAAHSVKRILHCKGDATGREMELALVNKVKADKNIDIWESTLAVDLLINQGICGGLIVFDGVEYKQINSHSVILATGGLGQIYKCTTNPVGATGDGLVLAYNSGAVLRDMEFVQFHPTALAIDDAAHHNRFLISEAVRGEGATLCDINNYEYMSDYDVRKELAPRDIVARANFVQMQKTNSECVYLNAKNLKNPDKRFPTIAKKCADYNIDIQKDLIPVAPAAHYFMGGVKTNLKGETSIKNLYAVGEVASTGLHGANRLASNSLLECVVSAYSVANSIEFSSDKTTFNREFKWNYNDYDLNGIRNHNSEQINILKNKLKDTMWRNVGIFRDNISLKNALADVEMIEKEFNKIGMCACIEEYELKNMLTVATLVIKSALNRKESRGAHYRKDFLQTDQNALHSEISKDKGEINFVK